MEDVVASNQAARTRRRPRVPSWLMTPGPWLRLLVLAVYFGVAVAVIATVGKRAGVAGYSMARLELAGTAARGTEIRAGVADGLTRSAILWDFWFIAGYLILIVVGALYFPARAYRVRTFRDFSRTAYVARDRRRCPRRRREHRHVARTVVRWRSTVADRRHCVVGQVVDLGRGRRICAAGRLHLHDHPGLGAAPVDQPARPQRDPERRAGAASGRSRPDRHPGSRHGARPGTGPVRDCSLRGRNQVGLAGSGQPAGSRRCVPEADSPGPSWATADKIASVSGGSYISGGISIARSQRRPRPSGGEPEDVRPNRRRMPGGGTARRRPTC